MSTNLYPQKFINPIDLQGLELLNAKVHVMGSLPSVVDYEGQLINVDSKVYWSDGLEWHDLSKLHIDNVHVDSNPAHTTIELFVAAEYTVGNEFAEGDVIVLTESPDAGLRTYIHTGGTAGDVTDFHLLPSNVSEAFVRGALSATGVINYDSANGVFSLAIDNSYIKVVGDELTIDVDVLGAQLAGDGLTYDATNDKIKADPDDATIEIDATSKKLQVKDGGLAEVKFDADVQARLDRNGKGYDVKDGETDVAHTPGTGVYVITHSFGTQDVAVVMRDKLSNYAQVPTPFNEANDVNTVTIKFTEQPTDNRYRVSIIPIVFPNM